MHIYTLSMHIYTLSMHRHRPPYAIAGLKLQAIWNAFKLERKVSTYKLSMWTLLMKEGSTIFFNDFSTIVINLRIPC